MRATWAFLLLSSLAACANDDPVDPTFDSATTDGAGDTGDAATDSAPVDTSVVDAPPLQSTDGMLTIDAWGLAPLLGGEITFGQAPRFVLSARHGLTPAKLNLPVDKRSAGPRLPTELRFVVSTPSRDALHVGISAGLLVTTLPLVAYYDTTLNIEGEPVVNIEVPRMDQALGAGKAFVVGLTGVDMHVGRCLSLHQTQHGGRKLLRHEHELEVERARRQSPPGPVGAAGGGGGVGVGVGVRSARRGPSGMSRLAAALGP